MHRFRSPLAALLVALAVVSGSCGGGGGGGFGEDLRRDLVASCSASESQAFCTCWVDELERRLTRDQVLEIVVGNIEPPPEYAEAARACVDRLDG